MGISLDKVNVKPKNYLITSSFRKTGLGTKDKDKKFLLDILAISSNIQVLQDYKQCESVGHLVFACDTISKSLDMYHRRLLGVKNVVERDILTAILKNLLGDLTNALVELEANKEEIRDTESGYFVDSLSGMITFLNESGVRELKTSVDFTLSLDTFMKVYYSLNKLFSLHYRLDMLTPAELKDTFYAVDIGRHYGLEIRNLGRMLELFGKEFKEQLGFFEVQGLVLDGIFVTTSEFLSDSSEYFAKKYIEGVL